MSDAPDGMRVLVCGGRDYYDRIAVFDTLDLLHEQRSIILIIHGAARGADSLADDWANARGIAVKWYRADWQAYGKLAGPIRNRQMLEDGKPDGVVAFPGGAGTANMIKLAKAAGLIVWTPIQERNP